MSETHSNGLKRPRHIGVRNASHVYKSQRADGSWSFEVRHPPNAEGRRLFEVVGTRLDAAKARAREVHGDSTPRVVSVGLTLAEVVEDWQVTRTMRPRSATSFDANLRVHVLPRFGRKKVREIDSSMILAWLAGLKRADGNGQLASGTRRLLLATLQIVLQHAVEMGALPAVPKLPRRRVPRAGESRRRVVTQDEEARLLMYTAPFPWLAPIITVALHQALRLGEVLGLQWKDVDFVGGKLHVRHSLGRDGTLGLPKGGKSCTIDLTPVAREALLEMRMDGGDGFIFKNKLGGSRQLRDVQRAFDKARTRASIPVTDDGQVVFHSLRHTGISRLANAPGVPITYVRDFARHSSLTVTNGYAHAIQSVEVTEAAARALAGEAS